MPGGSNPAALDDLGAAIVIDSDTLPRTAMPVPAPIGLQANGGSAKNGAAVSGAAIVNFATGKIGKRVGDGECFALVDQALRNAGAKSAADFGTITPTADYIWGSQVNLSDVSAGDIIQFKNYRYDRTIVTETSTETTTNTDSQTRPHHTAIVEIVGGQGALTVLEQNVPSGGAAQRTQLFFSKVDTSSGSQKTTITVQGSFRFFRPQAR